MKMKKFVREGDYERPAIERIDVPVEKGFAQTGDGSGIGGGLGEDDTVEM